MKTALINALSSLGYPIYLQGTLNSNESFPESFITFWIDSSSDNSHYDNVVSTVDWSLTIMFYSSNPVLVNTVPATISSLLRAAGFIPQGKGCDLVSDTQSYTGWATEYKYIEKQTT